MSEDEKIRHTKTLAMMECENGWILKYDVVTNEPEWRKTETKTRIYEALEKALRFAHEYFAEGVDDA